jgi:type I restriction enzyme S subunit
MRINTKWEVKKLREVCIVIAGQSPEGNYYNNNGNGLPFYQGKKEFTDKYVRYPKVWTTKITKEAQKGDILISVRAPVGPINFATEKICIGRGLAAIRPISKNEFSNDYLFFFLMSIQDKIKGSVGAVFASINKNQIENILVPVPPIDEQKKIVAKLDKFSENIKKLEKTARKNLQNAKDLFNSVLNETFKNKSVVDSRQIDKTLVSKIRWETRKLGEICEIVNGRTPKTNVKEYWNGTNLWITPAEMGKRETPFVEKTIRQLSDSGLKNSSGKLLPPYSVILSSRAPIGHLVINTKSMATGQGCKGLIPSGKLFYLFLYYYLYFSVGYLNMLGTGTIFKELSTWKLKEVEIPFPLLLEQKRIIAKLDKLSEETKKLEIIYQKKIDGLTELKKSVLKQTFDCG